MIRNAWRVKSDMQSRDPLCIECIARLKSLFDAVRPSTYLIAPQTGTQLLDVELELNANWSKFALLSDEDWMTVRAEISQIETYYLWTYAIRMAEIAVRRNEDCFIRFGLMALIVDDNKLDRRDVYTALALLLDSAKRLSCETDTMFEKIGSLGTAERSQIIIEYYRKRRDEASALLHGADRHSAFRGQPHERQGKSVHRRTGRGQAHRNGRRGESRGLPTEPLELAVAVNGVVRAVTSSEHPERGSARFSAMLPEGSFRPGRNTVEVFVAKRAEAGLILQRGTHR